MLFKNKRGFTLIELMITLSLVVILLSVTTINLSFFSSGSVRADLDTLRSICLYLQRTAMATNKIQHLIVDVANNSYTFNGHVEKLSPYTVFGVLPNIKGPPATPTGVVTNPVTFPQQKIAFHPNGIVSAGTVYLTDTNKRVQYALSSSVAQVSYLRTYIHRGTWVLRS